MPLERSLRTGWDSIVVWNPDIMPGLENQRHSWVTLGKCFKLSESLFSHQENENDTTISEN